MKLFLLALFVAAAAATPVAEEEEESGPFAPAFYSGVPLATTYGAYGTYGLPATTFGYGLPAYTSYYGNGLVSTGAHVIGKRSAEPEPLFLLGRALRRAFRRGGRRRYVSRRRHYW